MILPLTFAQVKPGVYRSGYPASKSSSFIQTLQLKSMISLLNPIELRPDVKAFCLENNVQLIEADIGVNKEPFLTMNDNVVTVVMNHLANESNLPCLIFCLNGKLRTSCMVGCIRREMGWSLSSIKEEFEQYTDGEGDLLDLLYIQNYNNIIANDLNRSM